MRDKPWCLAACFVVGVIVLLGHASPLQAQSTGGSFGGGGFGSSHSSSSSGGGGSSFRGSSSSASSSSSSGAAGDLRYAPAGERVLATVIIVFLSGFFPIMLTFAFLSNRFMQARLRNTPPNTAAIIAWTNLGLLVAIGFWITHGWVHPEDTFEMQLIGAFVAGCVLFFFVELPALGLVAWRLSVLKRRRDR
ncbi:MAG: hypothetical protein IPK60_25610 [Sandaracinaceae bacterium]|nr:hypothetical protein [Sandaracinaceae bacterium]